MASGICGGLSVQSREAAPSEWLRAASALEQRFGLRFSTLTSFGSELIARLHSQPGAGAEADADADAAVTVASRGEPAILSWMDDVRRIANLDQPGPEAKRRYRDHFMAIYAALPVKVQSLLEDASVGWVAPEREGAYLAMHLGWLPSGRSLKPHAKRIPFYDGLLVGLVGCEATQPYSQVVIVDGAIASGATLISAMESLRGVTAQFLVLAVHAAPEGIVSVLRYAKEVGVGVHIVVGHVSGSLNDHFYAMSDGDPTLLEIGDVGDMIAEVE